MDDLITILIVIGVVLTVTKSAIEQTKNKKQKKNTRNQTKSIINTSKSSNASKKTTAEAIKQLFTTAELNQESSQKKNDATVTNKHSLKSTAKSNAHKTKPHNQKRNAVKHQKPSGASKHTEDKKTDESNDYVASKNTITQESKTKQKKRQQPQFSSNNLKQAMLHKEILGKPKSMR